MPEICDAEKTISIVNIMVKEIYQHILSIRTSEVIVISVVKFLVASFVSVVLKDK